MEILIGHFSYLEVLLSISLPVGIISMIRPFSSKRKYLPLIISILIVAPFYIVWDELAVIYGTWSFNGKMVIGLYFFRIPIEEVLFFIVVPFSTLLIYEGLDLQALSKKSGAWIFIPVLVTGIFFALIGLLNLDHSYTAIASFFVAGTLFLSAFLDSELIRRARTWAFMVISFIPFIIFDHILVSLPVFTYGKDAIIGIRIFQIPMEEYFYVFSLLLLYLLFYDLSSKWILTFSKARKKHAGPDRRQYNA